MKLPRSQFDLFPTDHSVTQKVFEHYYDIAFPAGNSDELNDAQKVLYYHFVCTGVIDNGGFISILIQTEGQFNAGYSKALEEMGNKVDKEIFDQIVAMYAKYYDWFNKQEIPPAMSEDSPEFDISVQRKYEELQKTWYDNDKLREKLCMQYLAEHKEDLVQSE